MFYIAIKTQTLKESSAVTWLIVGQQLILKFKNSDIKEYILTRSKHLSTHFMSPILYNLYMYQLSKIGNLEIY